MPSEGATASNECVSILNPRGHHTAPVTHAELLLRGRAGGDPTATVDQSQLLVLGEDLGDPLWLFGVMPSKTPFSQSTLHLQQFLKQPAGGWKVSSPVPHVLMLHHAFVVHHTRRHGDGRGRGSQGLGLLARHLCPGHASKGPGAALCAGSQGVKGQVSLEVLPAVIRKSHACEQLSGQVR